MGGTALGGAGGPAGNHPRRLGGSVDRDQQTNIFHLSVNDLGYPGEVHVQGRGGESCGSPAAAGNGVQAKAVSIQMRALTVRLLARDDLFSLARQDLAPP